MLVEQLKSRTAEIDRQIRELDADFKVDRITGDAYLAARLKLSQSRSSIKEELHRLGVTTT